MRNRCANLALDVVSNDWESGCGELLLPLWLATNEDWDCVNKRASCFDRLLSVVANSLFAADREVGNENVNLALLEHSGNIHRLLW